MKRSVAILSTVCFGILSTAPVTAAEQRVATLETREQPQQVGGILGHDWVVCVKESANSSSSLIQVMAECLSSGVRSDSARTSTEARR